MWEPGGSSNSSTNNNRAVVVLVTTLSLCVLLYKAWGPLLFITCALVLVVHTCYSLLVNDSLFAPHTLVLLRYAKDFGLELILTLKLLFSLGFEKSSKAVEYLRQRYDEGNRRRYNDFIGSPGSSNEDMNGRQRNTYRLSTTGLDLSERASPINHDPYHSFALNGACDGARTSTPIPRGSTWRKGVQPNGDLGQFMTISTFIPKKPSLRSENKQSALNIPREETLYSPKGSPWGNSISPKIRERVAGVKAVQTIAGPLLASTRYNIDPKIYTDVSSPGLTTRLTKYASEANSKLMHQHQYAPGQFPKVNLHASPTPLLSPKTARARVPVTVRVAPPEIISYSPLDSHSHQERHKMFSNNSTSELKESTSCPSIDPVLKKISLKRHASREDMLELAKKQRAEKMYYGQLENLEEMMQKRARDESMTSEDELSPQSKTQRPTKRPKASSCHDILHSLSSSLNVFSGVKRKAIDTSRSNTPEIEKHFKPSTISPNRNSTIHSETELTNSKEQLNTKYSILNASGEPHQHKIRENSPELSKTKECSPDSQVKQSSNDLNHPPSTVSKAISVASRDSKLTEKLFMRAEPQTNEKLKTLIEEQGNVEAKFTTDGKDEIKKRDIVNMRQNSMRLRLQSMFDAISGKSANKIDPDVVIQAEEINLPTSSSYTSLSSLTSTTTVNTAPITTTIVPILKNDTETKSPTTKHVTFDLPVSTDSNTSTVISTVITSVANKESTAKPAETKNPEKETSSFGGFIGSSPPLAFNFSSTPNTIVSSESAKPATTSGLIFPKPNIEFNNTPSTVANNPIGSNISIKSTNSISTSSNDQPTSTMIATISTSNNLTTNSDSSKNTIFSMNSSGFAITSVNNTVMTTAVPVVSFTSVAPTTVNGLEFKMNTSTTTVGNTTISVSSSFANPLLKTPTTTSVAQPTLMLPPASVNDKKDSGHGGFSFGANMSTSNSSNSNLGQTVPNFNIPIQNPVFSAATMVTTSATPAFTFGSATKSVTTGFSFGASTAPIASNTTGTTFGAGTQVLGTNIGTSTTTFVPPSTSIGTPTIAGASATPAFGSSSPSLFGASNSSNLFSGSSNPAVTTIFKSPSTTTSATTSTIFGSQTGIPAFGASPGASLTSTSAPTLTTATTATPSLFSNIAAAKSTTASTIPSLFGNMSAVTTTTTICPRPTFGESAPVQQQVQPNNIFSGMTATTSGPTSIFGSAVAASTSGTPTGLFSGSKTGTQNTSNLVSSTTDTTSIFGQSKTPSSMPFGTTSPSFGQVKPAPSFGLSNTTGGSTSSAFQIGSSGVTMPSFNTGTGVQSTSVPSTSIFGSGFGSPAPASSNSSGGGGFGVQANTTTSTFGAASPSFGTGSSVASSPFGGQATTNQAPSLFTNVTAPAAASFTFGAVQSQQQPQPQQQTSSFSFGGSTNSGASSTGGLFQFGSTTTNKPAGFNFNAPAGTPSINFTGSATPSGFNSSAPQGAPPTFNAPPTNMFSIGSSSSTPRSRTSRQRRQR